MDSIGHRVAKSPTRLIAFHFHFPMLNYQIDVSEILRIQAVNKKLSSSTTTSYDFIYIYIKKQIIISNLK